MHRYEIINRLIQHHGYKNYLEIGLGSGECIAQVNSLRKTGVDPAPNAGGVTHRMSSNAFFASLDEEDLFDLIFIDSLHLEAQVDQDITHALRHLSPGGTIVLHDCNPPTAAHTGETTVWGPPANGNWNGTVY